MTENYKLIKSHILSRLRNGLSKELTYHTVNHTRDVLEQAERIAKAENITNEEDLFLLKVACLYHDSGFLYTYAGHEEESCNILKKDAEEFKLDREQVQTMCGLIMATKIPQNPQNKMEEIICDADLDYLGTTNFFAISDTLFLELKTRGLVNTKKDWDVIQVNFLKQHHYFTKTSQELREKQKLAHLGTVESMI